MLIPTRLGKGESPALNIASLSKGEKSINSVRDYPQGIVSKVKSILTELYLVVASRKGLRHSEDRSYHWMWALLERAHISDHMGRVTRSNKPKNGEPKETNGMSSELWDCLREGAKTAYGNRALIVPGLQTWGRRAGNDLRKRTLERHGYRGYSTHSQGDDKNFPRKFLKLAEFCNKNPNHLVPDDLFSLMLIPQMYQIAYNKLKSNPGNMTPGIKPQTLDGISLE